MANNVVPEMFKRIRSAPTPLDPVAHVEEAERSAHSGVLSTAATAPHP